MSITSTRSSVLSLYKQILRRTKISKKFNEGESYYNQALQEFRKHKMETDPALIQSFIKIAKSKLYYLDVVIPRAPNTFANTKEKLVYKEGSIVSQTQEFKPSTIFRDDRIDPDDLARHKRLVEYVVIKNKK